MEADVGLGDLARPVLSLVSATVTVLLCGLVIHMATGGTDATVGTKWTAASLMAGVAAVALGVVGIEDSRRGRLACLGSLLLVGGVIAAYHAIGPAWIQAL